MSCLGPDYNPVPPRAWSRVQNPCMYQENNVTVSVSDVIKKGNILQYKKNASGLTQKQRYAQIAKGQWTNRTTTWASQTQTATNPNVLNLKQINYVPLPWPVGIADQNGCVASFVKEGGILLGNTYVDPCTDEVIKKTYTRQCSPTSESDVPGPIIDLCWPANMQTWYPKSSIMRIMNNSTNKWPVNYKLFKSANSLQPYSSYTSQNFYSNRMSKANKALANGQIQNPYRGINLYTYIYNNFKGNTVTNTTNTENAVMNVNASNLNVTIVQNLPPVVIDFTELQAKSPVDLEANEGTLDYASLSTRVSYIFNKIGSYIGKKTLNKTNVMLPLKVENYNDIILTNSSTYTINVLTYTATQTINSYFFANGDQVVSLAPNNTGSFRFVVSNTETGDGNWIANIF